MQHPEAVCKPWNTSPITSLIQKAILLQQLISLINASPASTKCNTPFLDSRSFEALPPSQLSMCSRGKASRCGPLNQENIECSGDIVSSQALKTKGAFALWQKKTTKKKKKQDSIISRNLSAEESERASEREMQGGDKDQLGKTGLLLRQLNSCCVWSELLIYGSKTPEPYSRGKWAADRSQAGIKSSFHQRYYSRIQFSLIKQSSVLSCEVQATCVKSRNS